jgi:hypothetical protein
MGRESKYRVFKISINLPFFHIYSDSKVYEIKNVWDLIIPVFSYSTVTILLGFFGLKVFKSLEALHTNFSGGDDYSKEIMEDEFDDTTNFVWNNLTRETSEKLNRRAIETLLKLQEVYMDSNDDTFTENNIYSLKGELNRKGYRNIQDHDIVDFFDTLRILTERTE